MRERIAKAVCMLTISVVVALSLLFASVHNEPPPENAPLPPEKGASVAGAGAEAVAAPENLAKGKSVYAAQKCSSCHSIAGDGNPRYPLDSVGSHLNREDLLAWTTGTGAAADILPPGIVRRKQRYRSLPQDNLDALVSYLSTLKASK
ncbi:MAG: cytochrome c [Opitutaceae bacterium]|nr:cytochrome c [Opitutaceae bacterium]